MHVVGLLAGIFFRRLASNSSPIFGLTQGQKFSNSAHFVLTQKSKLRDEFFWIFTFLKRRFFQHFHYKKSNLDFKHYNLSFKVLTQAPELSNSALFCLKLIKKGSPWFWWVPEKCRKKIPAAPKRI